MSERYQVFAAKQCCHRTARNRWRFQNETATRQKYFDKNMVPSTEINRFYRKQQHRKSPTRTMSKRQQHPQKVSFQKEKIVSNKKCWRINVLKCSHLIYLACLLLSFFVEPSLCNTPPRYYFLYSD